MKGFAQAKLNAKFEDCYFFINEIDTTQPDAKEVKVLKEITP